MKVQVQVLVPVTICVSVVLLGIIKVRKTEQDREDKRSRFQDTKLRVTYDVLREYQGEKVEMQKLLDKTDIAKKALEQEVNMLKAKADKAKADADICQGNKKSARDGTGKIEAEFNNLKAEKDKEAARWKAEVETLKQKLEGRSKVCDYVKKESSAASKLCSNVVIVDNPKKEEPKVEAPKKEEPKAEVPKKEEPKVEAPKKEEPKPEVPKKEEPKAEAPKKEEPKAEAPKKEEPKAEAPKKEEPKKEAPKAEAPKKT